MGGLEGWGLVLELSGSGFLGIWEVREVWGLGSKVQGLEVPKVGGLGSKVWGWEFWRFGRLGFGVQGFGTWDWAGEGKRKPG